MSDDITTNLAKIVEMLAKHRYENNELECFRKLFLEQEKELEQLRAENERLKSIADNHLREGQPVFETLMKGANLYFSITRSTKAIVALNTLALEFHNLKEPDNDE